VGFGGFAHFCHKYWTYCICEKLKNKVVKKKLKKIKVFSLDLKVVRVAADLQVSGSLFQIFGAQ